MKCRLCKEEIHLYPSATERARKHGETPAFYTHLFSTHTHCQIRANAEQVSELIASQPRSSEAWELPRRGWNNAQQV